MEPTRFYAEIADAPEGTRAFRLSASDGVAVRVAHMPSDQKKGTVLLFPGRTEYIEKYGRVGSDLAASGYDTLAIDWRGQGLADRLLPEIRIGHVGIFTDYQRDVEAMVSAAEALDLPKPWFLLAHSMGGCIGLRSLMNGLPVAAAAFSGPMWGIQFSSMMRPAAWALSWSGTKMGLGGRCAPGTKAESYIATEKFETNLLTRDAETFEWMQAQVAADPGFQLGGPSLQWVNAALVECRDLAARRSPDLPCLCFYGANERIVDTTRIEARMAAWPKGEIMRIENAEHEVLMEVASSRKKALDAAVRLFESVRNGAETQAAASA